jgi:hypothetical protein
LNKKDWRLELIVLPQAEAKGSKRIHVLPLASVLDGIIGFKVLLFN